MVAYIYTYVYDWLCAAVCRSAVGYVQSCFMLHLCSKSKREPIARPTLQHSNTIDHSIFSSPASKASIVY